MILSPIYKTVDLEELQKPRMVQDKRMTKRDQDEDGGNDEWTRLAHLPHYFLA